MQAPENTSWSMVLGAATGELVDREAFSVRYGPVIRAYLAARWHLGVDHDAVADATSDVFVECFKEQGALSRVEPGRPGGFRAFLYGVVKNVALMAERKFARRRDHTSEKDLDLDAFEGSEETLSVVFDRAWAQAVVKEARGRMVRKAERSPAAQRRYEALALRFEQGLPPREISVLMQLPVERVYELLKEGRSDFRTAMLEVMAGYHPGCSEAEVDGHCRELLATLG